MLAFPFLCFTYKKGKKVVKKIAKKSCQKKLLMFPFLCFTTRCLLSTHFLKKIVSSLSIYDTFSVYRYYFGIFFTFSDKYFLFFFSAPN